MNHLKALLLFLLLTTWGASCPDCDEYLVCDQQWDLSDNFATRYSVGDTISVVDIDRTAFICKDDIIYPYELNYLHLPTTLMSISETSEWVEEGLEHFELISEVGFIEKSDRGDSTIAYSVFYECLDNSCSSRYSLICKNPGIYAIGTSALGEFRGDGGTEECETSSIFLSLSSGSGQYDLATDLGHTRLFVPRRSGRATIDLNEPSSYLKFFVVQ